MILINDIANDIRLFADDTSLFVIKDDDPAVAADSLTDDLDVISNWAKSCAVQFNSKKLKIFYLQEGKGSTHLYFLGEMGKRLRK